MYLQLSVVTLLLNVKVKLGDFVNSPLVKAECEDGGVDSKRLKVTEANCPTSVNSVVDQKHTSWTFTLPEGLALIEASASGCASTSFVSSCKSAQSCSVVL